ncbi:MAG: hypothetical protein B7Z55_11710 [Planctomycetales bacterium 12-60-4]|nr:MAG: hypothetical protein B7Z55_11710 [Planctomycetales bacterium 12-60-4]
MLNTGRFLWDFQKVDAAMDRERDAGRLWSKTLNRAGYQTYMAGKWHVRTKSQQTFDVVGTERPGMPDVVPQKHPHAYNRPRDGVEDTWNPANPAEGGFWQGGRHWSEVLADETLGFFQTAAKSDRSFFMYVAFNAAHDPRQAPQPYLDLYPAQDVRVPVNFLPEYPFKDRIGCPHSLRDEFLAPMPRTRHAIQVHRREYYALITHMDAQIGRILEGLETAGLAQKTWIFFTADHGLAVGQHGLLGKQNLFDHSVRVPFFVVGPGVPAGTQSHEPIYYQDVMPTTLDLAGLDIPEHVSYQNLLPIIRGKGTSKYRSIYNAYIDLQRAVTMDGWKLLLYPKVPTVLLYHTAEDPHELSNLADEPQHQSRIQSLFAELLRWQAETGDKLDVRPVFPELQ